MNEQARISYYLSEQGRKDSLRQGGDGKRQQFTLGIVSPNDLEVFVVDEDGGISFDATVAPKTFEVDNKHRWALVNKAVSKVSVSVIEVLWDVVPTWDDLLQFARWTHDIRKQQDDEQYLEWEAEEAAKERAAYAFLADPNARAEKVSEDYVTIAGHDFWSTEERVVVEARARFLRDAEELKKANRATLAEWTAEHGTDNQRQRLAAGLLPWKEVYEAAEEHLYAPLSTFPLYRRFQVEQVCHCLEAGAEKACKVKFQSVDAVELTADEWDRYSKIRAGVPNANFQLREHRAECQIGFGPEMRRGVIVKMSLGKLTFKREFALTEQYSYDTV